MKALHSLSIFFLFVLINACNGDENEKKVQEAQPASKDSIVSVEKLPAIEKEFDTINIKPVERSVLLKFNFQKGKTYNSTMSFDVSQQRGEQSRSSSMKWNYDMQVIDDKAGLKTLKATYKKIEMAMDMGGQKMEFSSEKETDAMDFMQLPSRMFKIVKGKSFTMQVNEKGEVVSVTGFDKIGEAVVNEANLPEEMKPMLRQNFQQRFNDDAVKQMFSQSFEIFPNKPVKIGDSWKVNSTIMKQDIATVYKVKNIKGDRVFLTGESTIKSDDGKNSGTQTSKLIIDAKTGLMIDGAFDQKSVDGNTITRSRIVSKEI